MKLSAYELRYFDNYYIEEAVAYIDSNYQLKMKDVIHVKYVKPRKFFPDKKWTVRYAFVRYENKNKHGESTYHPDKQAEQLIEQLRDHFNNNYHVVNSEQYELMKREHPEFFI